MGTEPQSWLKSKLVRFMFAYFAVILALTYTAEWMGRHGPALRVVFAGLGIGIVLYVGLRIAAWWRGNRMW